MASVAGVAALAIISREDLWALARLRRIEHIQTDAAHALNTDDADAASRAIASLSQLYAARADARLGLKEMKQFEADILDGRYCIRLAERYLVAWRDAEAHRIIAHAARRITFVTTVAPTAALDMLFVAAQNLRMLRELATLYGGRPSTLATFRLARMVIGHLAVTGGLALSDNLVQHVVGKGLLGRLSARFGEGAVNGILTARVGLARRLPPHPAGNPRQGDAGQSAEGAGLDRRERDALMFLTFFTELRGAGLPVSLKEYLTLMEALGKGLAQYSTRNSTISRAQHL